MRALEESRLVTLTGVGGVGKTRLALRVVREVRARFPGGVRLVELSSVRRPESLREAIRSAIGEREAGGVRRSLLVLDNCEHLVESAGPLVDELISGTPGLRVMVTSRRVLGAVGESAYQVEPLPIDGSADGSAGGQPEAVTLFADRAAGLMPGFVPTPEVALLCRRLDGIPLAIELAATRLRTMSFDQIMGRIDDRFSLLSGFARTPVRRHRTLRMAIGWSHELCEPEERMLWARLSVFSGDFDLPAARTVCAGPAAAGGVPEAEDVLSRLVDRSIVQRVVSGRVVRYRMLDTVREYGGEWLRRLGLEGETRRRHRDHYLALARRFDREWFGPSQMDWHDRMIRELPNLRAALDFSFADPAEQARGVEMAARLAYFWIACGFVCDGRRYLSAALSHLPDVPPGEGVNRALWVGAWLADVQGDLDQANDLATECMSRSFAVLDRASAGWATACCATTGLRWGYLPEALGMYERARRTHEEGGDLGAGLATALVGEAYVLARLGRREEAMARLRRHRSLCDSLGDIWMRSSGDWVRGFIELEEGDAASAARFFRASLRAKHLLGDSLGMTTAVSALAAAAARSRDMERAARLLGVSELIELSFGLRVSISPPDDVREATEDLARSALGADDFTAAFQRGRAMDVEAAVAYALEPPSPVPAGTDGTDGAARTED
ncbi:LuxR family transcriptional regulator [Sphaerisporangium rubeum]|uniref:Non-specific serine/threonine protein kinase n=1 Tax=Sphaerisporangium rubeum TaxID=321317 RepID=A0A7X0IH86_9ACTN|nr:non-specific serine/threonine protein kinase [Sphaerisporangium rubeum]